MITDIIRLERCRIGLQLIIDKLRIRIAQHDTCFIKIVLCLTDVPAFIMDTDIRLNVKTVAGQFIFPIGRCQTFIERVQIMQALIFRIDRITFYIRADIRQRLHIVAVHILIQIRILIHMSRKPLMRNGQIGRQTAGIRSIRVHTHLFDRVPVQ